MFKPHSPCYKPDIQKILFQEASSRVSDYRHRSTFDIFASCNMECGSTPFLFHHIQHTTFSHTHTQEQTILHERPDFTINRIKEHGKFTTSPEYVNLMQRNAQWHRGIFFF